MLSIKGGGRGGVEGIEGEGRGRTSSWTGAGMNQLKCNQSPYTKCVTDLQYLRSHSLCTIVRKCHLSVMDSNLRYRLSPTLLQQPLHSVVLSNCLNPLRKESSVSRPHLCTGNRYNRPTHQRKICIKLQQTILN